MADASWFDDELEVAPRPRRRLVLVLALVAAAWIAVTVVLVRGHGDAPASGDASHGPVTERPSDEKVGAGHDDPADHATAAGGDPAAAPTDPAPSPDPGHGTVGREEAEALALGVVRGWLSDAGPDLGVPGIEVDRRAYLEHAAVESIDLPSDDLAVARVLLVLLVREDDHYVEATVRRAAVPLTVTPTTVHPGGSPWWLPSVPDLTPVPPTTEAIQDPDLQETVLAALARAGYRDPTVTELAVTATGTVVAEVTASTPAGDEVAGPIWLAPTPEGPVVLGGPHTDVAPADPPPQDTDDTAEPQG